MNFKNIRVAALMLLLPSLLVAAPVAVSPGSTFSLTKLKPIELNAGTYNPSAAPGTCSSRTVSWSGSASCSASVGALANGGSASITDSTGNVGTATVTCNAATNSVVVSGASSCTTAAAANKPCPSQTVSWGACSGPAGNTLSGNNFTATDSIAPSTGSANFTCNDSVFVYSGGSCVTAATSCTSKTLPWSVGGNSCSAPSGVTSGGQNKTISNTAANGNSGSATFSCTAASDSYQLVGSPTCAPVSTTCTAQTVGWIASGSSCSGSVASTANNGTRSVASTNGNSGSAVFACNAASNTYTTTGTPSCSVPAPSSCSSQSKVWGTSPNNCSASTGTTAGGTTKTVSNTNANGNTGSASFVCNASTDTYTTSGTPSCSVPAPTSCSSQSKSWGTSPNNCSASTGTTAGGATKSVSNTNANGNTGSASFVCNASTDTYTVSGTSSCSAPSASACTSQSKSWGTSPNNCSATTGATNNGATSSVANSNANGNTGSASFVCNASTDTYTVSGTPSCSVPAATSCTSQTKTWGTSPNNCSATTGATNNGATSSVANSNPNGNSGSASFVCNAATNTYSTSGTPTCSAAALGALDAPCERVYAKSWTVGGLTCTGELDKTWDRSSAVASSSNATSGSSTNVGSATFLCSNGVFQGATNATCAAPGGLGSCKTGAQNFQWTGGGVTCYAPAGNMKAGEAKTVESVIASSGQGTAQLKCPAISGGTPTVTGISCGPRQPVNCPSHNLNWTSGSDACTTVSGVKTSGTSFIANASGSVMYGSAGFTCDSYGFFSNPSNPLCKPKKTAIKVGLGYDSGCILVQDGGGNVMCWHDGKGESGAVRSPTYVTKSGGVRLTGVKDISVGYNFACALQTSGEVDCWRTGAQGSAASLPARVSGIADATSIHSGVTSTCAILADKTVKCWGASVFAVNDNIATPQTLVLGGTSTPVSDVAMVSNSGGRGCVVKGNGQLLCWGGLGVRYNNGLVLVSDIVSPRHIDVVGEEACAVASDGRVACWKYNDNAKVYKDGLTNAAEIKGSLSEGSAGLGKSWCVKKTDGFSYCWGWQGSYQYDNSLYVEGLNDGFGERYAPSKYLVSKTVKAETRTINGLKCVVTTDGFVYCHGNSRDRLSINDGDSISTPPTMLVY